MSQTRRGPEVATTLRTDDMPTRQSTLGALARIFRFEYLRATFPGLTLPFLLCGRELEEFFRRAPIEGLLVAALIIFSCLGINAIVDRDIDGQYLHGKNQISSGVGAVGPRRVWTIIIVMNVIALALTIDLCIHFRSWIPLALALGQAFFAYGYSLPPLEFKLRGVFAHAISLSLGVCFLPFILAVYAILGEIPATVAVFMLGFSVGQYGFEYVNQALDYLEDSAHGLKTPAVRLGVVPSLTASLVVPVVGVTIMLAALLPMYIERSEEPGRLISMLEVLGALGISAVVLAVGYYLPITRTWQMLRLGRREPPEQCVPKFPNYCHYALWQASSVAGVSACTAVFFVVTNYVWA